MTEHSLEKDIEKGAILKVWIPGDETPYGFTDGHFRVDVENGYLEVRTQTGEITGAFFSMFEYIRDPEDEEEEDVRGYN